MSEQSEVEFAIGGWLSAAMDDPNVCGEMKVDITRWFNYLDTRDNALRALVKEWREEAEFVDGLDDCADQLEEILGKIND